MTVATLLRRTNAANQLRQQQAEEKKRRILARCRQLMADGFFQPGPGLIADLPNGVKVHDLYNLFGTIPALYEEALDNDTARAIARAIMRRDCEDLLTLAEMHHLAGAAVFGRTIP